MRRRIAFFGGILLLALFCLLWFRNPRQGKKHDSKGNPLLVDPAKVFNVKQTLLVAPGSTSNSALNSGVPPSVAAVKEEVISRENAAQNQQSLDFYGRVVDQYGIPVPGAKVQGNVMIVNFDQTKDEIHLTETDINGSFKFIGLRGSALGIWPQKPGYTYDLKQPSKRPEGYRPDPGNVVEFTMWKIKGAEYLLHGDKFFGIQPDNRLYTIDLLEGIKIEGLTQKGDFTVRIQRPIQIDRAQKFDWSVVLDCSSGGFKEAGGGPATEAPDSGYIPQYRVNIQAGDPSWSKDVRRDLYLKSRNGAVYGILHVQIIAVYQDRTMFSINYLINPAGSRNLEYDGKKVRDL